MNKNKTLIPSSIAFAVTLLTTAAYAEPYTITLSQLKADEASVIAKQPAGLELVRDTVKTLDNAAVEAIVIKGTENPDNVKRVERIVDENEWAFLFPDRHHSYTYLNFLKGVGKFPAFCGTYQDERKGQSDAICRKSLATMFAHFAQETGGHDIHSAIPEWRQALVHVREMGWDESKANGYGECSPDIWQGQAYPCGKNEDGSYKSYFGRGAKQLSYNYNYGLFSEFMFGDTAILLNDPARVADSWLNIASAVFFYVTPQSPKPSMLHAIDGTWQPNQRDRENGLVPGFGVTTQIINGGVECGGSTEIAQSRNRIQYYKGFTERLGVEVPNDEVLGCAGMKQFDEGSSAALNVYWEKDWGWTPDTETGDVYKCQLVSYQGPYSAFLDGHYQGCVEKKFDVIVVNDMKDQPPVANAGHDIFTTDEQAAIITLSGEHSTEPDGDSVAYYWEQLSGPQQISPVSPHAIETDIHFAELREGENEEYVYQLTVSDKDGASTDTVTVTRKHPANNEPPTVHLTGATTVTAEREIDITATVTDPENDAITHYNWMADRGSFRFLEDDSRVVFQAPAITEPVMATITLEVTDQAGNVARNHKSVSIKPAGTSEYDVWVLGKTYKEGDKVSYEGDNYQCKAYPESACCGVASAYQPGEGYAWGDAWIKL